MPVKCRGALTPESNTSDYKTTPSNLHLHPELTPRNLITTTPESNLHRMSGKDIWYGAAAGCVGKLIEFPFDTVKVRLQLSHTPNSTVALVRDMLASEGFVNGFYKGIKAPMVGACAENAVLFLAFQYGQSVVSNVFHLNTDHLASVCLSGAFSGFAASFVLTPVELVKCQLQVSNLHRHLRHESYGSIVRRILADNGVKGLWHGLSSTLLREVSGTAVWFAAYEQMAAWLKRNNPNYQNANLLASGAFAGVCFNLAIFPVDTIKSNIQTHDIVALTPAKLRFSQAVTNQLAKSGGVRNLYSGLSVTLVRSIPANAAIFYVYEWLKQTF